MIKKFEDSVRLPIIGKIRLGVRKLSQGGKEYPSETDYFVLDDAPDVAKVYGDSPTALEAIFPVDDLNKAIPNYYKWYSGGIKDKTGQVIGGKLNCIGNGVMANHHIKRDPISRIVPERQCLVEKCPDWKSSNGQQQCKASMSVFVILPRVSLRGLYQIDTTSVVAIQRFVDLLLSMQNIWGTFKNGHYLIYRDPVSMTRMDDKGKQSTAVHHILSIRPDENFILNHGAELQQSIAKLRTSNIQLPSDQILIEGPMEDNFPLEQKYVESKSTTVDPVDNIKVVANDPELMPLFDKLVTLKGKKNDEKIRILTARKFEKESNIKQSLHAYLVNEIKKEEEKAAKSQASAGAVDTPPASSSPPESQKQPLSAEGLI